MAETPSQMIELGTPAPEFSLPNTLSGETTSLADVKSDIATVVMFICNHCPYVINIQQELKNLSDEFIQQGVSFVAISSNDVENYPEDSPDKMKALFEELGLNFPYLYDESQEVAKAYKAACTPDFYVFDKDLLCAYRGRFDDSTPGNSITPSGRDLRGAIECLVSGKPVSTEQLPSLGCNIKWKN